MKTTLLIFLIAISAHAQATVFQDASIPADSQLTVRTNIKNIGGDAHIVAYTNNPLWQLKSDNSVKGYVDCIRINNLGVQGFKNLTLPQFEAQITKNVRPPDKQKIKVQTLKDLKADYEPVPVEEP